MCWAAGAELTFAKGIGSWGEREDGERLRDRSHKALWVMSRSLHLILGSVGSRVGPKIEQQCA